MDETSYHPRAVRQIKYERLYVVGVVCPESGEGAGLLSPAINSDVVNIFLKQFTEEVSRDVHVLLLRDQAGLALDKPIRTDLGKKLEHSS